MFNRVLFQRDLRVICVMAGLTLGCSCSRNVAQVATTEGGAGTASVPGPIILQPGTTFTADHNPLVANGSKTGVVTLSWTTNVKKTEVRVGSPGGTVFAQAGGSGHGTTGNWVTNGTTFYLQDATSGHPDDKTATLATLTIAVR